VKEIEIVAVTKRVGRDVHRGTACQMTVRRAILREIG
jgi:hypothetical protein